MADESGRLPARAGGGALGALALVLALAAAAGAAYVGWREWRTETAVATRDAAHAESIAGAEARLTDRLRAIEASVNARSDDVARRVAAVESGLARLGEQVAGQRPDARLWQLAELSYLLRMAELRARLAGDRDGALAHLGEAMVLTRSMEAPAFASLEAAIDAATAELARAQSFDAAAAYARLAALRVVLETAPVRLPSFGSAPGEDTAPAAPAEGAGLLERVEAELGALFDFRRREETSPRPLLRPDEERYLRMNLALAIEAAQVALLRRDAAVYSTSLAECDALVQRYLDGADARVVDASAELAALRALDPAMRLPDIRHLLDTFEQVAPRASPGGANAPAPSPPEPAETSDAPAPSPPEPAATSNAPPPNPPAPAETSDAPAP
jgi:uroporphyrin-3 C-methyltransferase